MTKQMKTAYEPKTWEQKLGYLVEEAGEVLAAAGKTIRWGRMSVNPELPDHLRETNIDWLIRELADLDRAIDYVRQAAAEIGHGPAGQFFKIPPSAFVDKQPDGSTEILPGVFLSAAAPAPASKCAVCQGVSSLGCSACAAPRLSVPAEPRVMKAKCGHTAYRGDINACTSEGCTWAAYLEVSPDTGTCSVCKAVRPVDQFSYTGGPGPFGEYTCPGCRPAAPPAGTGGRWTTT